ncbi:MAG: hypothetical protein NW241_13730 [Bacteroidia bacterium]|nr:hypothetical protein [Bacteroidia bacterium]
MKHVLMLAGAVALLAAPLLLSAQRYTWEEQVFAFEVKHLDEFVERFNYDPETLVLRHLRSQSQKQLPSREELILTLFNGQQEWDAAMINRFIARVTQPGAEIRLNLRDPDWYAELACRMTYRGKPVRPVLILTLEHQPDGAAKWVIRGVRAPFLQPAPGPDTARHLNPIAHGTDFMSLGTLFTDPQNLRNYLYGGYRADELSAFAEAVRNGALVHQQVDEVTYHLLQIPGWMMVLRKYYRNESNSGWLIDTLLPAGPEEKSRYRSEQLQIR